MESPALRGFVGERGRFATTSLYLVLLSNRWVSAELAIARGKAVNPCALFSLCACVKKQQIRLLRDGGGIRTLGLRFALPKDPGPGVTGAYFPFYTCRRRSIDAAIFAPKKQQIPHQRDGVVSLPSARAARSRTPARPRVRRAYFAVLRAPLPRCRNERSAQLLGLCFRLLPRRSEF